MKCNKKRRLGKETASKSGNSYIDTANTSATIHTARLPLVWSTRVRWLGALGPIPLSGADVPLIIATRPRTAFPFRRGQPAVPGPASWRKSKLCPDRSFLERAALLRPGVLALAVVLGASLSAAQSPVVDHPMVHVPVEDVQPGGPAYDFRVSRFELQNDEFVAFLNDALEHLTGERGAYLYFDAASGDVYVSDREAGSVGSGGTAGPLVLDAAANGRITLELGRYRLADPAFGSHPVAGVSWFGAVKFCNWLTLASGLSSDERAYSEGPSSDLAAWRPVTIAAVDWAARDLTVGERGLLLDKLGYRLAMDGGGDGPGPHNEWSKYASAARDVGGAVVFDALYGYGRSKPPTPTDANYLSSGDPFEPGSSPVGFYNGVNLLTDGTPTRASENAFGLHDLSGNLWEWMQDQAVGDPTRRRNRGGSWQSSPASLRASPGSQRSADAASASTGFRVVQRIKDAIILTPQDPVALRGPWGGPYEPPQTRLLYRLSNVVHRDVDYQVSTDASWLEVDTPAGTLAAGDSTEIAMSIVPRCEKPLPSGTQTAILRVIFGTPSTTSERQLSWVVLEPLSVAPSAGLSAHMVFGGSPQPSGITYTIASASDRPVAWSATWEDTTSPPTGGAWVTLNGAQTVEGEAPPHGAMELSVALDVAVVAGLSAGVHTANVTITDRCTGSEFVRPITLTVGAPFELRPEAELVFDGGYGGPFEPASHRVELLNLLDAPVSWSATLCADPASCGTSPAPSWLAVIPEADVTPAGATSELTVSLTPAAASLPVGRHAGLVRFLDTASGFVLDRDVVLEVVGLQVEPVTETFVSGPRGGPFSGNPVRFTLHNTGSPELHWTAVATTDAPPGIAWISVAPSKGTILDPDGTAEVEVSLSVEALALQPGSYRGLVRFATDGGVRPPQVSTERFVTLTVGGEAFALEMVLIPGDEVQPGGPTHSFRIGKYEVTNREFARFLNDARRNPSNGRGAFLYHDRDSGSVYLHDAETGAEGEEAPSATHTLRIYDASVGRIDDVAERVEPYVVEIGFEDHPATGVSWYGAAKFCNWLTLIQGMPPEQRVYAEGPSALDWHSTAFDPTVGEPRKYGFRLPLDGGAAGVGPRDEWFKAAARKPTIEDAAVFGAAFGFGRDGLSGIDANFLHSGDPFDEGTTPAGFFDGVNLLADGRTRTAATDNGYGLHDLCGSVAEWVHEADTGVVPSQGATRGGHFQHPPNFAPLQNEHRESVPADGTFSFVGFRAAQSVTPAAVRVVQGDAEVRAEGFVGGPFTREEFWLQLHNDGPFTLDDIAVAVDVAWLEIVGVAPTQIPAGESVELVLRLAEAAEAMPVSPVPPGSLTLVPASDVQLGGPTHDFWVSTTEVTNDQFLTFLNDARANPDNGRGSYVYFDLDSGDAYIHSEEEGGEGTAGPSAEINTRLYNASLGRIHLVNDRYAVEEGFGRHPVVGVTWFGAIKYCNWLTPFAGLPSGVRAYTEGPLPSDWHPITVATPDWPARGLTDEERASLIARTVGYRLPMDAGVGAAAVFNEWHKAAAARTDSEGRAVFDAVFGFGRNLLSAVDANFIESGDTAADSTTLVSFFDGVNLLDDESTRTAGSENRYGLVDACGNVAEWTADLLTNTDPVRRSTRGGHWGARADSYVLTTTGRLGLFAQTANPYTGFRVIRGTGHVAGITIHERLFGTHETRHVILDLREPLRVEPPGGLFLTGGYCENFAGEGRVYTIDNRSAAEMPWSARVEPEAAWLSLNGEIGAAPSGVLDAAPNGRAEVSLATDDAANRLPPGDHSTELVIANTRTGTSFRRPLRLSIAEPILVSPQSEEPIEVGSVIWGGPVDQLPAWTFSLSRAETTPPGCELEYQVSVADPWLTVTPAPPTTGLSGPLPDSAGSLTFEVRVDESASSLAVGEHVSDVEIAFVDSQRDVHPDPIRRRLALEVRDPVGIEPADDPWVICCRLTADDLPSRAYTLTNGHDSAAVSVAAAVDVSWVDVTPRRVTLLPGALETITVGLNQGAIQPHGEYPATVTFTDENTGHSQTRKIVLQIQENLSVTPLTDFLSAGRSGGPFTPAYTVFTLTNTAAMPGAAIEWNAAADQPWLLINGSSQATGSVAAGSTAQVILEIDAAAIPALPTAVGESTLDATVTVVDLTHNETAVRIVHLTVVSPRFAADEVLVSGDDAQPGGPEYPFHMGRFHVTNAEFVLFLDDALDHPLHPRGQYMYFDSDTGDVYVNTVATGEIGAGGGGRAWRMFRPSSSNQIRYVGGRYEAVTAPLDYSLHPATGVSWYGSVKFCNWLTLDQGLLPSEQCYTEGPHGDAAAWRPVTIAAQDWAGRDLSDVERETLVVGRRGYRLPMDDGYNNATPTVDFADDYDEWFKAAAWNAVSRQNVLFGFGRDILTSADANYRCSGDGFEDPVDCARGGTTPTGYFDGTLKGGAFLTTVHDNTFGLFDMTGNVHQWLQDRFAPPNTIDRRTLRGGSWNDPVGADSLRNTSRVLFAAPTTTSNQIGFRVVRVPAMSSGDFDRNGLVDLADAAGLTVCPTGPGVTAARTCTEFDFDSDSDVDLLDLSVFQRLFRAP